MSDDWISPELRAAAAKDVAENPWSVIRRMFPGDPGETVCWGASPERLQAAAARAVADDPEAAVTIEHADGRIIKIN